MICATIASAKGPDVASDVWLTKPPSRHTVALGFSDSVAATLTAGVATNSSMPDATIALAIAMMLDPSFMKIVLPGSISASAASAIARFSATSWASRAAKFCSAGRNACTVAPPWVRSIPSEFLQERQVATDGGGGGGDEGAQFLDRQGAAGQQKPFDLALPLGRIALNLGHNSHYTSDFAPKQSLTIIKLTIMIDS